MANISSISQYISSSSSIAESTMNSQYMTPQVSAAIVTGLATGVSAIIAACVLLFNESRKISKATKIRNLEKSKELYSLHVAPILDAADDIVGRYFDIISRKKVLDFKKNIDIEGSIENTICFRFVRLFEQMHLLDKYKHKLVHDERLSMVHFYTDGKLRRAIKGNVSKDKNGIGTETQEQIGAVAWRVSKSEGSEYINYELFVNNYAQFSKHMERISIFCDLKLEDQNAASSKALVLTLIYLIDLVQDFRPACKWEEFRLILISLLKTNNSRTNDSAVFLYKKMDLSTDNYFNSFNSIESRHAKNMDLSRFKKWIVERKMMKRIRNRQNGKTIDATGVCINGTKYGYGSNFGDLIKYIQK